MLRVNTLFQNVCYHPMQHQMLTTGTDRKVAFWETYDASKIRELEGSLSGSVNAMDISTDGEYFVTGGDDKLLKVDNKEFCCIAVTVKPSISFHDQQYKPFFNVTISMFNCITFAMFH